MREIKFRAYSETKKEWIYFVIKPTKENIDQTISFGSEIGRWLLRDGKLKSWGQYIGSKDKNGKESYEGDIVKWKVQEEYWTQSEVKWSESEQGFRPYFNNTTEIIGNIWESKHLLSNK